MEDKKSNLSPALSQLFFESVMRVSSELLDQHQLNSKLASNIDHPSSQPNSRDPQLDTCCPSHQPQHSSIDDSSNLSGISEESSNASCEFSSCSGATLQPHHHCPVPYEYFKIQMDDAADRFSEAVKFYRTACSYSFMFEFYIKILGDLFEELANAPTIEACQEASTLCQRLRLLQLQLIGRRNKFLGYPRDQWRNEKIRLPAGVEIYLVAAAEARAARQRQCQMVVLIQTIADLRMKEGMCKQRRLQAEAQLLQYFEKLKQSSDDSPQMHEKLKTASDTASDENATRQNSNDEESLISGQVRRDNHKLNPRNDLFIDPCISDGGRTCENDDLKLSHSQVQRNGNECEFSSAAPNCTLNDSSNDPVEKKTVENGADVGCFPSKQVRPNDNISESSSACHHQNDLSNDRYCFLWMESSEMEKSSTANLKIPLFIQFKPSSTCLFCDEFHWSHLCLKMPTLEGRRSYYRDHHLCFGCGTTHEGVCADTKRVCLWPHCRAVNSHHSALCPSIEYPITAEVVQAYERRINDLNRLHKRRQVCKW